MQEKDFEDLIGLLTSVSDRQTMRDFLFGLLTEKERQELAMRLKIVKRLLDKVPQQQIANGLKVGVATVSRGSREIKLGHFKILENEAKN